MTGEVVDLFPRPKDDRLATVANTEHNREGRDGQGPPIGSQAWTCARCGCFAFYFTLSDIRCYECHNPQVF